MYAIDYAALGRRPHRQHQLRAHCRPARLARSACRRAPTCCCNRTTISASRPTSTALDRSRPSSGWPALRQLRFSGTLPMKKYNRFMLIGDGLERFCSSARSTTADCRAPSRSSLCEPGLDVASCFSIAAFRLEGDSSVLRQRDSQPEALQPLGAYRLLGLAAGGKRNQDRAAAGLQDIADRIVAGLRHRQFGRGEQCRKIPAEPHDVEAARRLGDSRVEIGLRQIGTGDQAPALGRRQPRRGRDGRRRPAACRPRRRPPKQVPRIAPAMASGVAQPPGRYRRSPR